MDFKFTKEPLGSLEADLIFVTSFEKEGEKSPAPILRKNDGGLTLDKIFDNRLSQTVQERRFKGKEGETLLLNTFGRTKAGNLAIIGLGSEKKFSIETIRRLGGAVALATNSIKARSVSGILEQETFHGLSASDRLQAFVEGLILANYEFLYYKKNGADNAKTLNKCWIETKGSWERFQQACDDGTIVAQGVNLARDLTNRPPNEVNPTFLAKESLKIAKENRNISCRVFTPEQIRSQKMGAILAVSQGSKTPPAFIHLRYTPPKKAKTKIALVGKGITFDTGGLNIKTREMELMKMDMAGSAAVIGIFQALARLKFNIAVEGFIAAAENMPSGNSYRPSDIIRTRAGKTVEIANTDAEGRLVLADALDFALESKPTYMIDMATLTGGAAYALGELYTPILGNDKHLIEKLLASGKRAGEPSWELPIIQEYKKGYLKGPADLKNSGSGTKASTISGALFLEEFVGESKWVHMDIASTAWAEEPSSYNTMVGATGNPVRTILYFLRELSS